MIQSVPIGKMRLYSHMRPGLQAGDYSVDLDQDFASTARPVDTVTKHVRVTAPRFGLAGSEIHSVFPPNNSVGPFHNRLPHIALKRRTLPWERTGDSDDAGEDEPWLALVVLADHEANFVRHMSVKDVLPSDLHDGIADDAVCDAIEVTDTTVEKVFPGRNEFQYLLHVRQVNVDDTENAGNDPDGFMAVVMANRLPSRGVRYGAYLISVENRFDELPDVADDAFTDEVGPTSVYADLSAEVLAAAQYSSAENTARMDLISTAQPKPKGTVGVAGADAQISAPTAARARDVTETRTSGWHAGPSEDPVFDLRADDRPRSGVARAAPRAAADAATTASTTASAGAAAAAHSTMTLANDMVLQLVEPAARLVRFPVLAHWQFECTDGFDFQELMINIDVGMIGHQPEDGRSADPPQFTATGHVLVDNLTRTGERVKAWYRSPLTPRQVRRRVRPIPYHSADQARSLGGDFREDLGQAAAFEIGRMLALADPAFLQELLRWRRDGFRRLKTSSLQAATGLTDLIDIDELELGIGRVLTRDLYVGLGRDGAAGLGPLIDPAAGLDVSDDDIPLIAAGLRTPIDRVRSALALGELTTPGLREGALPEPDVVSFDELTQVADKELGHLGRDLDRMIETVVDRTRPRDRRRNDG